MDRQKWHGNELGGKHSGAQSCHLVRLKQKTEKHDDLFLKGYMCECMEEG